ncbi:hypothetical protein GCM10029992_00160 [Glycomyces albus]
MSVYEVGLRLRGKTVLVVGGGAIAARRVPRLLDAGAHVNLVAPEVTTTLGDYADSGELHWERRPWRPGDADGAWFVLAATDDPEVNAAVAAEAEAQRIWCVRADDAEASDAWTLARTAFAGVSVAVSASGDPARAAAVRDAVAAGLRSGELDAPSSRPTARPVGAALIGSGPGDADLITLRGLELLRQAEVVVSDRLASQELLDLLDDSVEIVDAAKLPYGRHTTQEQINAVMVERALAGKFVVRLKGGDGFVFGRGAEELDACVEAGVPVQVVPGVSSAIAARPRPASASPSAGSSTTSPSPPGTSRPPTPRAASTGRRSPGRTAPWCCSWPSRTAPRSPRPSSRAGRLQRGAHRRERDHEEPDGPRVHPGHAGRDRDPPPGRHRDRRGGRAPPRDLIAARARSPVARDWSAGPRTFIDSALYKAGFQTVIFAHQQCCARSACRRGLPIRPLVSFHYQGLRTLPLKSY